MDDGMLISNRPLRTQKWGGTQPAVFGVLPSTPSKHFVEGWAREGARLDPAKDFYFK
jgi:hypothetical protein